MGAAMFGTQQNPAGGKLAQGAMDKRTIECRSDISQDYNRKVDARHAGMVWTHSS